MNEQKFFAERESDWKRLTRLTALADVSPAQLKPEEVKEMFTLYKRASDDLALARTQSSNPQLVEFLNGLVSRAYGTIYRPTRRNLLEALMNAIALAAQTVRRRKSQVFLSMGLFIGSAVLAFVCMTFVPETRTHFIPLGWEENFEHWKNGEMEERNFDQSSSMTGFYMMNNPRVSVITGAVAASTFGIMTAKLMFDNGAILGALAHEVAPVGRLGYLFVRIMPHGVPELSGIILSGAAGFTMGWALIFPGRRTRGEALKESAKDALTLLVTAITLMFIAAPIEGFFSFNPRVPDIAKALFALVSGAGWLAFWIGFGRTEDEGKQRVIRLRRATTQ